MNRRYVIMGAGAVGAIVLTVAINQNAGDLYQVETDSSLLGTGSAGSPLGLARVYTDADGGVLGTGSAGAPMMADLSEVDPFLFGSGSDGNCVFDGSSSSTLATGPSDYTGTELPVSKYYTLTKDIYCETMSVAGGTYVDTAGWRVFVRRTLTLSGYLGSKGKDAVAGVGGGQTHLDGTSTLGRGTGGGGGGSLACGIFPCTNGTDFSGGYLSCSPTGGGGGASLVTLPAQPGLCRGGGGGATTHPVCGSVSGCRGGNASIPSPSGNIPWIRTFHAFHWMSSTRAPSDTRVSCGTGGGGGIAGSYTGFGGSTSIGGGGGGGGGCVVVMAYEFIGGGKITAAGGDGGNASCSNCTQAGPAGGGGGGGGVVHLGIGRGADPAVDVSGGEGGNGADGTGVGASRGMDGADGGSGIVVILRGGY